WNRLSNRAHRPAIHTMPQAEMIDRRTQLSTDGAFGMIEESVQNASAPHLTETNLGHAMQATLTENIKLKNAPFSMTTVYVPLSTMLMLKKAWFPMVPPAVDTTQRVSAPEHAFWMTYSVKGPLASTVYRQLVLTGKL